MSNTVQMAFRQGLWLSFFRFCTQIISWGSTIIIARLLSPEDYGLMSMATVLSGYAMIFTELGFGAAIIQRPQSNLRELSSIFWFTVLMGFVFGGGCFILAYPTAAIFNEARVIPLTRTVSIIFILNGFKIVPINLMKKNIDFKKIGSIEMIATLTSIIAMILIAFFDGGVWTLILGHVTRSFVQTILYFTNQKWKPTFYFKFSDVKSYLNFGVFVILASSFLYIFEKADQFFGAMYWSATTLGLYNFAIELARLPNNKLISLIKQVSYPVFSIFQANRPEFNKFYLNINKFIAIIVFPLYIGGFLVGKELIMALLDEKWYRIIPIFKILCASQVFLTMSSINDGVNNSLARPSWPMVFHGTCAIIMSISFYFAARHGMHAMLIPWITIFPLLCIGYLFVTSTKIDIGFISYLRNLSMPVMATFMMAITISMSQVALKYFQISNLNIWIILIFKIALGSLSYIGFLLFFDRNFLLKSYHLLYKKNQK